MDKFSRTDDVTLVAVFGHFANPYVSMPMVGTCRRVFITWTKKRREFALDEVRRLKNWLRKLDVTAVASGDLRGGQVDVRALSLPLCAIEDLVR